MKSIVSILVLGLWSQLATSAFVYDSLLTSEWEAWKLHFNKTYDSKETEAQRKIAFFENKRIISEENIKFHKGENAYHLELGPFADLLGFEFNKMMKGSLDSSNEIPALINASTFITPENVELPSYVDWRNYGAVTEVKNQGSCGSCWAFSATGVIEGQHFRKTGNLVSLSEQNLVDCSSVNYGCDGGWAAEAIKYVQKRGGIDTETSYPYQGRDHLYCHYNRNTKGATVTGLVRLPYGDDEKLMAAVATVGPIAVSIDTSHLSFQNYQRGILGGEYCTTRTDHAVLLIGYGTEGGVPYWLLKNSWGTYWGESGFFRLSRQRRNNCGISGWPVYPLM